MKNFRKLKIWQESYKLSIEVIRMVNCELPGYERYGLASQISRSAVSIPSNISEGCSRSSVIEFIRFIEIALGSAFELETQLLMCKDLNYANEEHLMKLIEKLIKVQKSINAYRTFLKSRRG